MQRFTIFCLLFFFSSFLRSQDTVEARRIIKFLCSEKCYGRGYLNKGLGNAEKFILQEIKNNKAKPIFNRSYTQVFEQNVNTFPTNIRLMLNGETLVAGRDYIPNPGSSGISGQCVLQKIDSVHYLGSIAQKSVSIVFKKKLTFSVAHQVKPYCEIEIERKAFPLEPKSLDIKIENKLVSNFKSKNIACYIPGTSDSDSCIVFSAHYDHLGGIGQNCYFPGANDNASGVSMVLSLLKHYALNPAKYKCIFLFFAGEEAGLLGSKAFVESNAFDLKKIKFLLNLDLLGTGEEGIMVVNGAIHEKEFEMLNQINQQKQLIKQIKKRGKAANSDHYWFSEAGVPCFFIYTMGGITAYHDVYDLDTTLPLTAYNAVFRLLTKFVDTF
ncbi:MAG: M20/M25/M40 family metallo-hydrolase [Bacteroidota bacterium]